MYRFTSGLSNTVQLDVGNARPLDVTQYDFGAQASKQEFNVTPALQLHNTKHT